MGRAQHFARGAVDVELYSAQFSEDRGLVPDFIHEMPDLGRSVLDVASFRLPRKLPLIRDILDQVASATEADYLVYTNVDIGLQPHFYLAVDRLIEQGHEAMVINRRTVAKEPSAPDLLPLIWSQIGDPHPGRDCFVFPRLAYPGFELGEACIGAPFVGKVLALNLACQVPGFRELDLLHLTFHLGNDQAWLSPELQDYEEHNRRQLVRAVKALEERGQLADHPLVKRLASLAPERGEPTTESPGRVVMPSLRQRFSRWLARAPLSS